jgi:hypothetical protein
MYSVTIQCIIKSWLVITGRGSSPGRGWEFFIHHHLQTGSGAHPDSYPMDTRGSFPGGKAAGVVKLTTHLHLLPRSKNELSYTTIPPIRLHSVVLG